MKTKKEKQNMPKNVTFDKRAKVYTVHTSDGKTKNYKTLAGAIAYAEKHHKVLTLPLIVTANTYFWSPAGGASGRRYNEERRLDEINRFCDTVNRVPTVEASGNYSESCRNVYKSMHYEINGRRTNITGLRCECARWGLELVY